MADITWMASLIAKASAGTLDGNELFRVVDDPAGTPASKKTTVSDIAAYVVAASQTWTGIQTFNDGKLKLAGSTSGTSVLHAAAVAGTTTFSLPGTSGTLSVLELAQTWTAAQTFGSNALILNGSNIIADAANVVSIRNGTNAQTFRIYSTESSSVANYERLAIAYSSGNQRWEITSQAGGTGTARDMAFTGGNGTFTFAAASIALDSIRQLRFGSQCYISSPGTAVALLSTSSLSAGCALEMNECSPAPNAPNANKVRVYAEDNGSGKTRLMALFPTGAAQQIAIEP